MKKAKRVKMSKIKKKEVLTPEEIEKSISKNLKKLKNASLLECHGFFMGKAQLVEAGLKGLLLRKYNYAENQIEKWTLGRVISTLKAKGVREDFLHLLEDLLKYRNSMAHDFLSTNAAGVSIAGEEFVHLSMKELDRALITVETTIQVYDFLNKNDCFEINKDVKLLTS